MKFHLDEHVSNALATALRQHGYNVTTAAEVGLLEAADELHVEHAVREGRVVIAHNRDYLMLDASGIAHAGFAYCHQQKYSVGQILTMCLLVDACYTDEEMRGHVEYIAKHMDSVAGGT